MSDFNDFNNLQVAKLPEHLRQYVVAQRYEKYTPIDQAVWRYVMCQNYSYLKDVAYYPYIKGLHRAGLSIEYIPDLQVMNDSLGKIGWGAVTVDGFIPPAAFMEYQSHKVLVIAADIRHLDHIEYTPAPDIIHESAGHAPIIADTDYNNYLSYFGSIGEKAMFSLKDFELYEAIRHLSILKESGSSSEAEIAQAEQRLKHISENMGEPSEMALLSRLHWWSVEYGLIGTLENPKIYGAGLLSSIGESYSCMQPDVKKLWYNLDTVHYSYDITKNQPQLFVTPTFQNLIDVLEAFADTMAFRRGGCEGIMKAISSKNVATAVYSSGLQVTGVFSDVGIDAKDDVTFLKTIGASALAIDRKELVGHGKEYHQDGFSSPVGRLKNASMALEDYSDIELEQINLVQGSPADLLFESGITLTGTVKYVQRHHGKIILIGFDNCTVSDDKENKLFDPSWGVYDMAVGEKIISVFNGAADKEKYERIVHVSSKLTSVSAYDEKTKVLHSLYAQVRACRAQGEDYDVLEDVWNHIKTKYRNEWLLPLEIFEVLLQTRSNPLLEKEIRIWLELKASNEKNLSKLIKDGLHVIKNPVTQLINE